MAVIDGTVNMNEQDEDLVLVSGGRKIVVMINGNVIMNVLDADLVSVSGGQRMAMIDGTVRVNEQDEDFVLARGGQKIVVMVDGKVIINGSDLAHAASHASVSMTNFLLTCGQCISMLTSWCQ